MGTRRILAAGAIVVAGIGVLGACGSIIGEHESDSKNIDDDFTSVRFDNDSGNVTITTGDSPSVKRDIYYEGDKPGETAHVKNGVLVLESCPVSGCSIDYTVVIPDGTKVDGAASSGDVRIDGAASVNVKSSSGNLTVEHVAGEVNAEASSGDVELTGIGGKTLVQSSSGNVTVALTEQADVRVNASSGNVEASVPDGEYRLELDTDSGEVENEMRDVSGADHAIELHTNSGDITLSRA